MARYPRNWPPFPQIIAVLAIILFVAAVLFPVFQRVPENRRDTRTGCASNLNQLGLALTQYTQDADEVLPAGINSSGNGWAGALYPFAKNIYVYRCPDDKQQGSYISYGENRNIVKASVNDLPNPFATVALYEFTTLNCDPSTPETNSATGLSASQDSKRHDGSLFHSTYSLNFLAVDGHVKYLKPGQVSGGPNAVPAKMLPQGSFGETFAIK